MSDILKLTEKIRKKNNENNTYKEKKVSDNIKMINIPLKEDKQVTTTSVPVKEEIKEDKQVTTTSVPVKEEIKEDNKTKKNNKQQLLNKLML